jgi:diguanylate cyclase (GGDEF)-like protein
MPADSPELQVIDGLRRQLAFLTAQARDNEQVLRRFQQCELTLIGSVGFAALFEGLFHHTRRLLRLAGVSLVLLDADFELRRSLEALEVDPAEFPGLIFADDLSRLERLLGPRRSPRLGPFEPALHGGLFSGAAPRSCAVLPLLRREHLIGVLTLGAREPRRYTPGLGTDFLMHLAAVAAVCLENATYSERLKHLGITDALTGVHNRRYFEERLGEEIARAARKGEPLACLLLDIDRFKHVNDAYGHQEGDRVLREAASRIKRELRSTDALARYGGEEFAVLLGGTDEELARHIAERVRRAIGGTPFRLMHGEEIRITLSAGVAVLCPGPGPSEGAARDLVQRADQALYHAKLGGRDRVCSDDPALG